MAVTQNTYTGDGATVLFSFTFPYLETTDIKVSVNGTNTTAYTLANATTIQFNTAPANGAAIRIYRQTDDSALAAQFYPGSAIRSQDLNDNFTQNLYVTQEVNEYAWDNETDTVKSSQAWVSSDTKIATTAAIDARFQDELSETITSSETWVSDDNHIATTQSIDQRIDTAITNDIAGSDGVTITDDGDGTITVGLAANSIDLDRLKDEDILTYSEQEAGAISWLSDSRIPTTYAAAQRFDTLVQPSIPSGSNWVVGKTWLQNDQDLTVSVWNGTNWLAVASGGAFTNQPKVVYVDATAGDDNNDGHRISRPKQTIKAAIQQINTDATYGDGSVVVVAPGIYQEVAPIDITKKDVSIIGTALRSCIVHPTPATETNSLFRVNSGTFLQNLTFTGVKASGARGGAGSVDPDGTYGLPVTQGWNVSFYPGALIFKSPYIQNCTNFSDSEINNANLNAHTPAGGAGGDTDSTVTGGGLLIDGAVVGSGSPLRSMVCDAYTHVGLDGPGILVTNNGYCQATSSYAFFNHYHIKCLNGGQANLSASTTDFGRYGLIADGRSTTAIFTATTTADAADQDITFTIGTPVVGANWHGTATRPQSNMLVDIGGNTYPILSAVPNGTGWDVTISRPDPNNTATNLGLDGAVLTGAPVSFFLRSMVASSGHTMEYAGSGTNYSALPENGGVPVEANQVVELNNGKVWTAITDHNGKFKLGNFFTVDQQTSTVSVQTGSFAVSLQNLQVNPGGNAVIGANLDLNGSSILDSTGNVTIADALSMSNNKIYNLGNPVDAQDAVTKNYVDSNFLSNSGPVLTSQIFLDNTQNVGLPDLAFDGDNDTGVTTTGANELALVTGGTARLTIDSSGNISVPGQFGTLTTDTVTTVGAFQIDRSGSAVGLLSDSGSYISNDLSAGRFIPTGSTVPTNGVYLPATNSVAISTNGTGRLFVDASGNVEITGTGKRIRGDFSNATHANRLSFQTSTTDGATSPFFIPNGTSTSAQVVIANASDPTNSAYLSLGCFGGAINEARIISATLGTGTQLPITFQAAGSERLRITSAGLVGIGTSTPTVRLQSQQISAGASVVGAALVNRASSANTGISIDLSPVGDDPGVRSAQIEAVNNGLNQIDLNFKTSNSASPTTRMTLDYSGRLLVGTSSAYTTMGALTAKLQVQGTSVFDTGITNVLWESSTNPAQIQLAKSRGASIGTHTVVQANDNLGRILFGGSDGADFETAGWIQCDVDGTPGANDMPGRLVFSTTADGASSPTERMRITSNGQLGAFTAAANDALYVSSGEGAGTAYRVIQGRYGATANFGGTISFNVFTNGNVQNTNNSYGAISDVKLKENVVDASSQWSDIKALQVRKYNFKEGQTHTQIGLIAQEAELVSPGLVSESPDRDEDGNDLGTVTKSVNYSVLYMKAVKALQEAMERIETLEAKVAALESA